MRARALKTQGFGAALSSGGSLYAKYGMGGPGTTPDLRRGDGIDWELS